MRPIAVLLSDHRARRSPPLPSRRTPRPAQPVQQTSADAATPTAALDRRRTTATSDRPTATSSSPRRAARRRWPTCRSRCRRSPPRRCRTRARTTSASSTSSRRRCWCRSTGSEANGSARIRGIGTVGDNPGLESSVAVFIDGVYRSRSGIGLNELGEIDRVEVLRGPQGTLGGRNASAGLISDHHQGADVQPLRRERRGDLRQLRLRRALPGNVNVPLIGDKIACRRRRRLRQARRLLPRSDQQHRRQRPQPLFRARPAGCSSRPSDIRSA